MAGLADDASVRVVLAGTDLTADERASLTNAIGKRRGENAVRHWDGTSGEELVLDASVMGSAPAALMFSGCVGCKYTIAVTCTKVFLRGCENTEIVLAEGSRVLTQTIEAEHCKDTTIRVRTLVCTMQVEQCSGVTVDVQSKEYFGNRAMVVKGREFGNDGMLVWAGCDNLRLRIAGKERLCDFAAEQRADATATREESQFKVHYTSDGALVSEKVIRLANGFPSTSREQQEHKAREEAMMAEVNKRIAAAIQIRTQNTIAEDDEDDEQDSEDES